jgi:hypothetical protein
VRLPTCISVACCCCVTDVLVDVTVLLCDRLTTTKLCQSYPDGMNECLVNQQGLVESANFVPFWLWFSDVVNIIAAMLPLFSAQSVFSNPSMARDELHPLFCGFIGREEACERLQGKPRGTFILRFSSSCRRQIVITFVHQVNTKGELEVAHSLVEHIPGMCFAETKPSPGYKPRRTQQLIELVRFATVFAIRCS